METSLVKIASKIMTTMGMYLLVISILWIFFTESMFVSDFLYYTGMSYSNFYLINPLTATLYIITKKLLGISLTVISFLILIITDKCFSKAEKWSWYVLLIAGSITWGSLLGYRFVIGYFAPSIVVFTIGTVLFVIGITLPAKEILGKEST